MSLLELLSILWSSAPHLKFLARGLITLSFSLCVCVCELHLPLSFYCTIDCLFKGHTVKTYSRVLSTSSYYASKASLKKKFFSSFLAT